MPNTVNRGYPTAFKAILICYGLVVLIVLALRFHLIFVNKTRDSQENAASATEAALSAEEQMPPEKRHLTAVDYEDITDFHTVGFRYRM